MSMSPRWPVASYMCGVMGCTDTEVVCLLCKDDGNRRRHKGHVGLDMKRDILARSKLLLTKAIMEYERLWGDEGRRNIVKALVEYRAGKIRI